MGNRARWSGAALALATLWVALALPEPAFAHGLSVGRQDLPIPDWLFAWAASLVLIVSFAILSFAWRTTRLQEEGWRALPSALSRAVLNPVVEVLCGAIGVGLLGVVIYSGLEGTADISFNFAGTFIFITFWLGMVSSASSSATSSGRSIPGARSGGSYGGVFRRLAGQRAPAPLAYPSGSAAGRLSPASSPSSGSSSSIASAASVVRLSPGPHHPPWRPSTAPTRSPAWGSSGSTVARSGRDLLGLLRDVLPVSPRSRCDRAGSGVRRPRSPGATRWATDPGSIAADRSRRSGPPPSTGHRREF